MTCHPPRRWTCSVVPLLVVQLDHIQCPVGFVLGIERLLLRTAFGQPLVLQNTVNHRDGTVEAKGFFDPLRTVCDGFRYEFQSESVAISPKQLMSGLYNPVPFANEAGRYPVLFGELLRPHVAFLDRVPCLVPQFLIGQAGGFVILEFHLELGCSSSR